MLNKGIGASSGIAIAKVLVLKHEEIKIEKRTISNVDSEIEKLNSAIESSIKAISLIKQSTLIKLGEEHAEIFEAHIQVASDPMMIDEYINLIKEEKVNADYAVNEISNKYIELFSTMDDEYMKERAADIKDVSSRIIKTLLNIQQIDLSSINEDTIIVAYDLTPSETAQLDKKYVKGFLTDVGGRTSHAAIMARSLEIPAILGLGTITKSVNDKDIIAMNGDSGELIINPSSSQVKEYEQLIIEEKKQKEYLLSFKNKKTMTKDGVHVEIAANIGSPADMDAVIESGAEAIGLFRSEFLYMDNDHWPTEEEQFNAYKKVIEQNNNKLVVIRTLDIGGDKTLKYFNFDHEMNPFLGYRAIRLTLDKKEIFETQLRALIRASEFGKLGIMFPMIATIDEFKQAKEFYSKIYNEVKKEYPNISNDIQIGTMIEIPSLAVMSEIISKHADFLSIGTNDLMQYSMAADRMNEKVSYLYQPLNPSILRLIKMTIDGGHANKKWVGMCGEMAGDLKAIPLLLALGLDEFSMSASSVLKARELISRISMKEVKEILDDVLNSETESEVEEHLNKFLERI